MKDSEEERPDVAAEAVRLGIFKRGRRLAFPVPDALMAVILALAATMDFLTPEQMAKIPAMFFQYREELIYALVVEGGFLMMQGTLVDIATRLKKRPPVWLIPFIVAAVALLSSEALSVLQMAWGRGLVVFIPLLLSLAERGAVLWNMPNRPVVAKLAARALIANRISTGLGLFGLITLLMIAGVITRRYEWSNLGSWPALTAGAVYFAVAAFDDWRVRGRKFAAHPRVLFGWDPMGVKDLSPL